MIDRELEAARWCRRVATGVACAAALWAAGCVKRLPPAPTPAAEVPPSLASQPLPAAGKARLVVDVVDGPTPVHRTEMAPTPIDLGQGRARYRFVEAPVLLCRASPCVADLPPGNHLLSFPVAGDPVAMETELVHVGPDASVYRRALSRYRDDTGATRILGIIATSLGGAAAFTGTALLPIGLAEGSDALTLSGALSLGAGAVLIPLGVVAIHADAPSYRPGSAIHFALPPGTR